MSAGGGDLQTSEESVVRETMGRERMGRLLLCSCLSDSVCVSLCGMGFIGTNREF